MKAVNLFASSLSLLLLGSASADDLEPKWMTDAPRARLVPRAGEFIGYVSSNGAWEALSCAAGDRFSTSGNWAGCGAGYYVTRCASGTVYYNGRSSLCARSEICDTVVVLENTQDTSPQTMLGCWPSTEVTVAVSTAYRTIPGGTPAATAGSGPTATATSGSGSSSGGSSSGGSSSGGSSGGARPSAAGRIGAPVWYLLSAGALAFAGLLL